MKKLISVCLAAVLTLAVLLLPAPLDACAVSFQVDFELNSKSVYLKNLDTDSVVFTKEPELRCFPASTTKIMTYIITAEHVMDLKNTRVTVKGEVLSLLNGTGSSIAGLLDGEELSVYQLLNCMMIPSGNDAALILADFVGGGDIDAFVGMMNDKARELGCEGTHFVNPHGLNNTDHYTTVTDMAKITEYAMTMPMFSEITNTATSDCLGEDRWLVTTNLMIDPVRGGDYYYEYANGIKTGSTGSDSGYCLVSTATKNGYTYLCIAYGAPYPEEDEDDDDAPYVNGAMIDSKNLYEWAFDHLEIKTIINKNDLVKEIGLNFAWHKDSIQLTAAESYSTILPEDFDASDIQRTYRIPESIDAPVKAGDKVGTVSLSYKDQELTTIDLIASENVDKSELLIAVAGVKKVVTSQWFILAVAVILAVFVIYLIVVTVYSRKRKRRRPVKKYRKF